MSDYVFKAPTSQEEYDAMKKLLRTPISDDEASMVSGGNDSPEMKGKLNPPISWTCHFCGATMLLRSIQDGPKHMTKCPNNPYK
jgi:hypothetical protein